LKKRSGANSSSKPLEPLVFFLDRSLGKKKIADALRQAGERVEVHDDHFPPDAKDVDWLSTVGNSGWIVFTKDDRIRYRTLERLALTQAGVRAFILTGKDLRGEEMAQIFIKALAKIKRFIAKHAPPFIAKVTKGGAVEMLSKNQTTRS